ncbi:hypothetical protein Sps_01235 [Shewanella psychrophila]|uniref:Uncharacterized protein n=1 Tax=Shewanella psychrophila TaxID=225848 RepID=A0A1S6HLM4_9GAMM|nr:hypothetical protein [Shewanella psychrophila]AQS36404.1 hypothetical protein Sps_01235 [Shewanella psychrophila]
MKIKKIGQAHLYYLMLITPIVALAVSSLFEDYHWSVYSSLGLGLVISGNLLAQMKPETLALAYKQAPNGDKETGVRP